MSGGAHEEMASYIDGSAKQAAGVSSGITDTDLAKTQYFDKYSSSSNETSYNLRKLGDATGEMGPFYRYYEKDNSNLIHSSWYGDKVRFLDASASWFYRGGSYNYGAVAGQFYCDAYGGTNNTLGSRLVLAVS